MVMAFDSKVNYIGRDRFALYKEYVAKILAREDLQGKEKKYAFIAACGYCEDEITRQDFADNDVALNLSSDPIVYHKDCCPCEMDQKLIERDMWVDVRMQYDTGQQEKVTDAWKVKVWDYLGNLVMCPFCFRVRDDSDNVVEY